MSRLSSCILTLFLVGCTPASPTSVPTGSASEAIGAYEVHQIDIQRDTFESFGDAAQKSLTKWLKAHPYLKVVSFTFLGERSDKILLLAFQDARPNQETR